MEIRTTNEEKRFCWWHLSYWAIIFFLLSVFLLLIAPGCVNPKAFENFSFASTIVSIVLAVVSIVYSFRSKSNLGENLAGIRAIEQSIEDKLHKLESLSDRIMTEVDTAVCDGIEKGIRSLKEDVSNLREDQADIKQNLTQISESQKKLFESSHLSSDVLSEQGKMLSIISNTSFIGRVAVYLACLSFKSGKDIDLERLSSEMLADKDYYWGYFAALSSTSKESFQYEVKTGGVYHIIKFDNKQLGDESYWRNQIKLFDDEGSVNQYLKAIDDYYGMKDSEGDSKE